MGLILEARSSCSFFESVAYGKAVTRLLRHRSPVEGAGLLIIFSPLPMSSCSCDDIPIIESSTEIPSLRQGILDDKDCFLSDEQLFQYIAVLQSNYRVSINASMQWLCSTDYMVDSHVSL